MTDAEFRAAFEANKTSVYRFAWRMTKSPQAAEDIAQETFLTLLRQAGRFQPARGELRVYLLGIARHLALRYWRQESRWDVLQDEAFLAEPLETARAEVAELVAIAVRSLPPLQREALVLAEYEGLTLDEISRAVDAEVGTVKARLHRARENLRRMLAPLREGTKHGTTERR